MDYQNSVLSSYQEKNFVKCLNLIEKCPISRIRDCSIHYKILKATCLVNLGIDIEKAHRILDEVLIIENKNEFAHYTKGLAFYKEKKLISAIECFEKAVELDKSGSMEKAKHLKDKASRMMKALGSKNKENNVEGNKTKDAKGNVQMEPIETDIGIEELGVSDSKKSSDINKTCTICDKTFAKPFGLKRHMLLHSGDKPNRCVVCKLGFAEKSELEEHMATHDNNATFKCPDCEKTFKTIKGLRSHRVCHRIKAVRSVTKAVSPVTKTVSPVHDNISSKKEHSTVVSPGIKAKSPAHIDTSSKNEESFITVENTDIEVEKVKSNISHVPISNIVTQFIVEKRPFKCTKCSKTFKLEKMLRYHESLHNTNGFLECDHCGQTFNNRGNIAVHVKTHKFKLFGCNLCSFTYSSINMLGTHFREFHGVGKTNL